LFWGGAKDEEKEAAKDETMVLKRAA
jgi:hypothetical protein